MQFAADPYKASNLRFFKRNGIFDAVNTWMTVHMFIIYQKTRSVNSFLKKSGKFLLFIFYTKKSAVQKWSIRRWKICNSSALLNRYMQNPFKIAFGDGILHAWITFLRSAQHVRRPRLNCNTNFSFILSRFILSLRSSSVPQCCGSYRWSAYRWHNRIPYLLRWS